jgi:hypothetical protein
MTADALFQATDPAGAARPPDLTQHEAAIDSPGRHPKPGGEFLHNETRLLPRPYRSCVTWSSTAYCSMGKGAGRLLKGLLGR